MLGLKERAEARMGEVLVHREEYDTHRVLTTTRNHRGGRDGDQAQAAHDQGPREWFTGDVWIDSLVRPHDHSTLSVGAGHFHPGARTAWHSHDGGQTLYVTEGEGRVQSRGEPIVTIRAGDVAHTPSGEWHWHGAAPDRFMVHLSLTEGPATWGDHVTDEEYGAP